MAEHEAKMISDRTKAALRAAKARSVKLGGDRLESSPRFSLRATRRASRCAGKRLVRVLLISRL
ncbi:MAG TPA: hypothetical protein VF783_23735 [Terriglobales bacterium]